MAKFPRDTPPTYEELVELLHDLLEWERHMGGWESDVWKRTHAMDRRLRKGKVPC